MKQWEYHVIDVSIRDEQDTTEEELDVLGAFGWELVSTMKILISGGAEQRLYFKRRLKTKTPGDSK